MVTYCTFSIKNAANMESYVYPELRILRVLTGAGEWQVGTGTVLLEAGDVVFVNNVENRRFLRVDESDLFRAEVFSFLPSALGGNTVCLRLFYPADRSVPVVRRGEDGYDAVAAMLDLLHDALDLRSDGELAEVLIASLISAVCSRMLLLRPGGGADPSQLLPESGAAAVSAALQYVNEHVAEPFDVGDLASAVYMSRGRFSALFRQYTGFTPAQYVRRTRVNNAIRLLAAGTTTVQEAALASGFTSNSGFYKAFASVCGATPTEYLRSLAQSLPQERPDETE